MADKIVIPLDVSSMSLVDRANIALEFLESIKEDKLFMEVDDTDRRLINISIGNLKAFIKA